MSVKFWSTLVHTIAAAAAAAAADDDDDDDDDLIAIQCYFHSEKKIIFQF